MKRLYLSVVMLVAIAVAGVSCLQLEPPVLNENLSGDEIVFLANSISAEVQTKATAVTESDLTTNGFKASCVTGSAGSDSEVWSNVEFGKSGTYWKGGKYWPTSDPTYRFYAVYPKSYSMTMAAAGATISASNAHDIVCAYASSSTYKSANTLTFNHIFARLGSVTVSAGSAYTISNITISITPKVSGTYNLRTGAWSSTTNGSATNIANSTPGTKSNDIYLVPGTYTLTASWTAANSPYSQSFSGKTRDITLVAGKTNNITCTLTGDGTEVQFGVSLTAWSTNEVDAGKVPLVNYPKAVGQFTINAGGDKVGFAPGNLQCTIESGPVNSYIYTGTDWCFAEHQWDFLAVTDGANSMTIGKKADLFGWVGNTASYNSYGLVYLYSSNTTYFGTSATDILYTDWGDIPDVVSNCGEGWYTLSSSEFEYIFNTRTTGVTLKGTPNARYTYATIRTDFSSVKGVILFPDNYSAGTPTGVNWGTINSPTSWTTTCTAAGWDSLEAAGCVFLPAAGYKLTASYINNIGSYITSQAYDVQNCYQILIQSSQSPSPISSPRRILKSVRLVKAVN